MANPKKTHGVIAILTGGGDVPGLNPAIRAVTFRALREGYQVIGLRRGWAGVLELIRDPQVDNSNCYQVLTEEIVNRAARTGGTFLHTSRTRPSHVKHSALCYRNMKRATVLTIQRHPLRSLSNEQGATRNFL